MDEGAYLYCVINSGQRLHFGDTGLNDSHVYTVPFRDIGAVVHRCGTEPYRTDDEEMAKRWILTHQYIVDQATARFGTVIPLTFDTIIRGGDDTVEAWLREEYDEFKKTLDVLHGKSEYGIKISLDEEHQRGSLSGRPEVLAWKRDLEDKPQGMAYLLRKRLEQRIRTLRDVENRASADRIVSRISHLTEEIRINERRDPFCDEGRPLILNLSCLVRDDKVRPLGDLLGELHGRDGLTVRFTGPWPPYSFVSGEQAGGHQQGEERK